MHGIHQTCLTRRNLSFGSAANAIALEISAYLREAGEHNALGGHTVGLQLPHDGVNAGDRERETGRVVGGGGRQRPRRGHVAPRGHALAAVLGDGLRTEMVQTREQKDTQTHTQA